MAAAEPDRPEPLVLTLVTDRRRCPGGALLDRIREAAAAGIDIVQVREKDLPDRALFALVAQVLAAAGGRARVLVNSRPDVASAAGAHGVQLPEHGLRVADVKRAFASLVVSASCHGLEAARRAAGEGADAILLGPVFPTPGKEDRTLGTSELAEVVAAVAPVPVFAIGGITAGTLAQVRAAGARGAAAIRPFLAADAGEAVRALRAS